MPQRPAHFTFQTLPHPAACEAAARRRMRAMETTYPAVLEWDLRVGLRQAAAQGDGFEALTQARIVGGATLQGRARASDPLGALRVAFNNLESALDAEHEHVRHRAAAWLSVVKRRLERRTQWH